MNGWNSTIKIGPCKHCGSYTHPGFLCGKNPKRQKSSIKYDQRSRISHAKQRTKQMRAILLQKSPPNHQGYVECFIGKQMIQIDVATVGHDVPRSRAPHLVLDPDNLEWECSFHNSRQGSRTFAEYLATNPNLTCSNISLN